MATTREVKYVCTKCKAEDTVRLFPNENQPQVINCWSCHAGLKMEIPQMFAAGVGMYPVVSPEAG